MWGQKRWLEFKYKPFHSFSHQSQSPGIQDIPATAQLLNISLVYHLTLKRMVDGVPSIPCTFALYRCSVSYHKRKKACVLVSFPGPHLSLLGMDAVPFVYRLPHSFPYCSCRSTVSAESCLLVSKLSSSNFHISVSRIA